jgi:protein-S-isoprenylcysteine O-methyltransferase Ste14
MYVGILSILSGEAWLFGSAAVLLYACAAFIVFHSFIVFYEEPTLRRKFGESYEQYLKSAPRWVPRRP